jgi:regulator of sigma E protease
MNGGVYLIGIVGLLLLVLVHEAGHFFAARLVGMKPTKFYLGFPPAAIRRRRNGIEYGIGVIPLGGYVKIPGMFRPAERDAQRFFGPLEGEHPETAPLVEDVRAALRSLNERAILERLDALERRLASLPSSSVTSLAANGIEELRDGASPTAYWRQATWRRIVAIAAGPFANLLAAVVLLTAVNVIGLPVALSMAVAKVQPGSPAAKGGLLQGDVIREINGKTVTTADQAHEAIQKAKGRGVAVVVIRNGAVIPVGTITPRKEDGEYLLGLQWSIAYRKDSPPRAVQRATGQTLDAARQIVTGLPRLVHPKERKQVSSVVGIVHQSGEALRAGTRYYLSILALISISLGILNLLPFLPLDGGHIVVALVERIRRRSLRRELVERFSMIGFALVGLMMYVGVTNDVQRYF